MVFLFQMETANTNINIGFPKCLAAFMQLLHPKYTFEIISFECNKEKMIIVCLLNIIS